MSAVFDRLKVWARFRRVEIALGLRVTIAALAALIVSLALSLNLPLWAVLTSIIVTQMSVGRSLKATVDYLVGTLGGAIYGGAVAIFLPHPGEGALLIVLIVAVAPLAFIAALRPAYNVATVTAIIVLLLPTMSHGSPLDSAIDRVLEVAVGAITGLAVSFLVIPSRAHSQIRTGVVQVLELMSAALGELLAGAMHGRDRSALHKLQDGIGRALERLNTIGIEAERERAARLSRGPDTAPLLRTVLRLRHDLVMIGRASIVPLPVELQARLALPLSRVNETITAHLRTTATSLQQESAAPDLDAVQRALRGYTKEIAALRREGLTRGLPGEKIGQLFALNFSLQQMQQNLKDLERCVDEWAATPPDIAAGDPASR